MIRFHTFLCVMVFAASVAVFSQTNETKPPESGGGVGSQSPPATSTSPCASRASRGEQAEILTDTMGVDFGPYMTNVVKTVRQNWYNVMPPSVYPPAKKQGRVSVEFGIQKDGKVTDEKMETSSEDVALDRAAWASIAGSSPFPPLPTEFRGEQLELRLYYFYNLRPDETPIYISPCVDVRVPAGSKLQFSVPIGGIERAAVTWSVSGPACEKMACGTMSKGGLYTAPAHVPAPPTVFVNATPQSNRSFPAQIQLTVVEGTPSR